MTELGGLLSLSFCFVCFSVRKEGGGEVGEGGEFKEVCRVYLVWRGPVFRREKEKR